MANSQAWPLQGRPGRHREMLTSHATLGAAVEDAFPGLTGMQLAPAQGIATRTSSMRDRTRPVHGKDMADPCGGGHARQRAWPAPPPRHGSGRALAARRGGEQA